MNGNGFMSWVLRSPFHGILSNGMMLITVTGRKTGKQYTTPVGFYEEDRYLWVLTSRNRTWWKNLQGGAPVSLLLRRQPVSGIAEPELESGTVETLLRQYVQKIPQAAKSMGIRMEGGKANADDVTRVAKERLFVRITLN